MAIELGDDDIVKRLLKTGMDMFRWRQRRFSRRCTSPLFTVDTILPRPLLKRSKATKDAMVDWCTLHGSLPHYGTRNPTNGWPSY